MGDLAKTKQELIDELVEMRRLVAELEAREPSSATSEEKTVEQALRASEEEYRVVVQMAHEGILVAQEGIHRFVNPAAARIWGYGEDELLSRPFIEFIHPDDRQMVLDRQVRRTKGEKPPGRYTFRILAKDGATKWVEIDSSEISWEDKPAVLVFAIDVTERKQMEEAIGERDEQYRALVEESFDGILIMQETKIIFVNSRLCQMLGYSREELEGMDHWLTVHPDDRDVVRERSLARLRGESVLPYYQVKQQRKDGSVFDAEIHARAIEIQGAPGVQVWIRDLSESKRAENAVRESEERFRTAFQTSPDPAAISRLSDGVFIEANDGFTELSGFTREEVIGKSALEVSMWHDQRDRDRLIAGLNERGYVKNLEALFCQKDGSVRAGLMSARILILGGEPHILSVTRDVEDWKKAEQALRQSEEKYRRLFEESRDAVYITTREGSLVDANQAFLDLFGFSREEARNMDILQIYTGAADRKRFQEEIERKGSLKDYEVSFRKKDGTKIEGLLTSTLRRDKDGKVLGYQGLLRDVTDRNRLQRQLTQAQKMEAIGTLAGGIAHDFNNLLQAILGYSDLLLMKKPAGDPDRTKLEVIQHAARDGADLVSRILMFSRKAESKMRPVDLNKEIRRVEKLLRRTLPRMIQIDLVLGEDLRIIDADPAQIEQVLLNLGVNAQHAMPDGGQLLIETKNVSLNDEYLQKHLGATPGHFVLLTISDTGVGMEPDVLDRIYEPFFTTKANAEGTGLGLSVVHGIVSQHGGYIRCYSEPGKGASFKIYFPISSCESIPDLTVTREMPAFGTETVLLVDDDDRIRETGRQLIEMSGYKVLIAHSGEEALETYTSHRAEISLIILDLIMPGMGGSRCLKELMRIEPNVAVLVASGYSENGLTVGEQIAGARGFIRKPYDAKEILGAIRKVLDKGHL
jgi:two-component system, cell cycle sensor histidine kinase and response regulator CckA